VNPATGKVFGSQMMANRPSIPPPTSRVASCASPIYPTSRSTGSAGMKRSSGAKSAKSCLPSTLWIVASRKIAGAVTVSVVGQTCRPMGATAIELRGAINAGFGDRVNRSANGIVVDEIGFVSSNRVVVCPLSDAWNCQSSEA
jgi:hypothetical protein